MDTLRADDDQQIARLTAEVFGVRPTGLRRLTTGQSTSRVYGVHLPAPPWRVVMKLNDDPSVLTGMDVTLRALGGLGLPVPQVIASRRLPGLAAGMAVVLSHMPGRDLRHELAAMTSAQMDTLAAQLLDCQARVATLPPGTGFGWAALGTPAPFASWDAVVRRDLDRAAGHALRLGWPEAALHLQRLFRSVLPALQSVRPGCFLDDLTTKNVMVSGGVLRGLVDFDVVCCGDVLYWLALTRAAVLADVGAAGAPYVAALDAGLCHTESRRLRAGLYTLIHALNLLGGQARTDTHLGSALLDWVRAALLRPPPP